MVYGFCYTRYTQQSGKMYRSCPGYKNTVKTLKGFGKFADKVAAKMEKSGRPSSDYSKKTGNLKKAKKRSSLVGKDGRYKIY